MKRRTPRSTPDYHYVDAACMARERLGIAAFAEELGLTPCRTEALIQAHDTATGDDSVYARCLDRGDVILAARSKLPLRRVENWISDGLESAEIAICPPPSLRLVLDALLVTVH